MVSHFVPMYKARLRSVEHESRHDTFAGERAASRGFVCLTYVVRSRSASYAEA